MRIDHIAIWTPDLEGLRDFYVRHFDAIAGAPYHSSARPGFRSCFLTFPQGGARLEIMTIPELVRGPAEPTAGYAHLAVVVGDRAAVDASAARLADAGVPVVAAPRLTGDGYYEAVIRDPDGNLIEITAEP